jgi:hypothetical protein
VAWLSWKIDMYADVGPANTKANGYAVEERGDEGIRRVMEMTLAVLPFPMDHGWFERYWYGDSSPSMWGNLFATAHSLCRGVRRIGSAVASAVSILDLSHNPLDPRRPF